MKKLSDSQIITELIRDLNAVKLSPTFDEFYIAASRAWLEEFAVWVKAEHPPYVAESFDCDDIALWAQINASRAIAESHELRGAGHAVRFCVVSVEDGGALAGVEGPCVHACILARCDDDCWYFLEPQTGEITNARTALDNLSVRTVDYVLL